MSTPRGIRNNNPGNIDRNPANKWQGVMPRERMNAEQRAEPRFEVFQTPAWGIRALARVLITYQDKHSLVTVAGLIHRWAPPTENNTGAYARQVAKAIGISPGDRVNTHDYRQLRPMVEAIIKHENAGWSYPADVIDEGLQLAGVVKPVKSPVVATPAGVATATALTTGASAALVQGLQEVMPAVQAVGTVAQHTAVMPGWLKLVVAAFVLASVAASGYALWNLRRRAKAIQP